MRLELLSTILRRLVVIRLIHLTYDRLRRRNTPRYGQVRSGYTCPRLRKSRVVILPVLTFIVMFARTSNVMSRRFRTTWLVRLMM